MPAPWRCVSPLVCLRSANLPCARRVAPRASGRLTPAPINGCHNGFVQRISGLAISCSHQVGPAFIRNQVPSGEIYRHTCGYRSETHSMASRWHRARSGRNMTGMSIKAARLAIGTANVVLLLACSGNGPEIPSVTLTSGPVVVPVYVPPSRQQSAQSVPGGTIGQAPGMQSALPTPARAAGRSGTYAGVMEPLSTAGGDINCLSTIQITGWYVDGNRVRFGRFHGIIDGDDALQMVYGGDWITGQFDGATFHGQLIDYGTRNTGPGCAFMISVQRVGP
jgi:hypothetical protein